VHWITLRIRHHEAVATAGLSGGRADGILEVRPGERERPSHNIAVDLSDGDDGNETFSMPSRANATSRAFSSR
jgi:hypothetical protein